MTKIQQGEAKDYLYSEFDGGHSSDHKIVKWYKFKHLAIEDRSRKALDKQDIKILGFEGLKQSPFLRKGSMSDNLQQEGKLEVNK